MSDPYISAPSPRHQVEHGYMKNNTTLYILVGISVVAVIAAIIIFVIFFLKKRHEDEEHYHHHQNPSLLQQNQGQGQLFNNTPPSPNMLNGIPQKQQIHHPSCPHFQQQQQQQNQFQTQPQSQQQQQNKLIPGVDFNPIIGTGKPALVLFYNENCGPCRAMMNAWNEAYDILEQDGNYDIIAISSKDNMEEFKYHGVYGTPTIRFYPNGFPSEQYIQYTGNRSTESIVNFARSGGISN